MNDYIHYFKQTDGLARIYNPFTKEFKTIDLTTLYKTKKRYALLTGYNTNDKGLVKFSEDFRKWVDEIKNNDVFKFDYLERATHESNIISIFKMLCHGKYEDFEEIDNIEYEWIQACNNAGLTYCKKGKDQCYGYDYSAQYPSILNTEHFHIPTKKGKQQKLKELPEYPELGYYKVRIVSDDKRFKKVFRFSEKHVYTNMSIIFANQRKKEGYQVDITLITKDDEGNDIDNAYIYGKLDKKGENKSGVIKCSTVFHKWYKYLFALKQELPKNKLVKIMMSSLWGRLCEYNRIFKTRDELINYDVTLRYDINHKYYVRNITYNKKKDTNVYEIVDSNRPYRYNIARIKPFLISKSRELTGKIAIKYIDDVVRIHTDNITFNKEHDDVIGCTSKFMTLTKEDKTTGLITFRGVACYRNHDNENYTTKNYKGYDDFGECKNNDFEDEFDDCFD
jgi:hypothetical protein